MTIQSLFHHLAIASTEYELRLVFLDTAGELFQAQAWGFTLLDQDFQIQDLRNWHNAKGEVVQMHS